MWPLYILMWRKGIWQSPANMGLFNFKIRGSNKLKYGGKGYKKIIQSPYFGMFQWNRPKATLYVSHPLTFHHIIYIPFFHKSIWRSEIRCQRYKITVSYFTGLLLPIILTNIHLWEELFTWVFRPPINI